jgi:hypothetical protein
LRAVRLPGEILGHAEQSRESPESIEAGETTRRRGGKHCDQVADRAAEFRHLERDQRAEQREQTAHEVDVPRSAAAVPALESALPDCVVDGHGRGRWYAAPAGSTGGRNNKAKRAP